MSTTLYALRQNTGTTVQAFPSIQHAGAPVVVMVGGSPAWSIQPRRPDPDTTDPNTKRRRDEVALAILGAI